MSLLKTLIFGRENGIRRSLMKVVLGGGSSGGGRASDDGARRPTASDKPLAAEKALDAQHGVVRYTGSTETERAAAYTRAAKAGGVGGYLDDTALKGQLTALPAAHVAYHLALLQRNGQTVPKKLVLSGRYSCSVW